MQRDFEFYLSDVANAITDIQNFTAGITFEQYVTNRMVQRAVERSFEIIGEALKQAEQNFPGRLHSSPEFSLAIRFRDRLAHGYFTIMQQIIWDIIEHELPSLQKAIDDLMN